MLTLFQIQRETMGCKVTLTVDMTGSLWNAQMTITRDGVIVGRSSFNPSWHGLETPEGADAFFDYRFTRFAVGRGYYEESRIDAFCREAISPIVEKEAA